MRVERIGNRTAIVELYQTAPFHVGSLGYRNWHGQADAIIQGVGPGLLPGDRLQTHLHIGENASLALRAQSATKIYPSPNGITSTRSSTSITTSIKVESGGTLIYLPGEVIPFRDAVFAQTTTIDVSRGARMALVEIVTPGRLAMGEQDAFTRLDFRLRIHHQGRLVLAERAQLEPHRRSIQTIGRHGAYPVSGSLYLTGDGWSVDATPTISGTLVGVGGSPGMTIVRILGGSVQQVSAVAVAVIEASQAAWMA